MKSLPRVLVHYVFFALLMLPAFCSAASWEVIAISGQATPGVPGTTLEGFQAYIAANGDVIFRGVLTGQGVNDNNDLGIWMTHNGQVELVAREGAQPPGYSATYRYSTLYDAIAISDAGEAYFTSHVYSSGPFADEFVTWCGTPGALTPLAREGSAIVGATPQIPADRTLRYPLLEGANVAFLDSNGPHDERIWSGPPNSLNALAIDRGQAPGLPAGVTYSRLEPEQIFSTITANASGSVAFNAQIAGPGLLLHQNDRAMFIANQGGGTLVAKTGNQAPGVESGATFRRLDNPVINAVDQVAFRAALTTAAPFQDDEGIWAGSANSLQLVARKGSQAPGAPAGRTFNFLYDPILRDDGAVAFYALLDSSSRDDEYGLWIGKPGQIQRVLSTGMTLPGVPVGFALRNFLFDASHQENGPLMNARGDIVFQGSAAPNEFSIGQSGVWALANGIIQSVLVQGDLIDVDPDPLVTTLKEVEWMRIEGGTAGSDGRRSSFNDNRQLVLEVIFTDGATGILRTTLVPEPATMSLLLIVLAVAAKARRARSKKVPGTVFVPPSASPRLCERFHELSANGLKMATQHASVRLNTFAL